MMTNKQREKKLCHLLNKAQSLWIDATKLGDGCANICLAVVNLQSVIRKARKEAWEADLAIYERRERGSKETA